MIIHLRLSFALVILFFIQIVGSWLSAYFYDQLWPIKILFFAGLVVLFFLVSIIDNFDPCSIDVLFHS